MTIRDGGVLLRAWTAEDADAVYRACQDPDIQRWTAVPQPYRREDAVEFVTTFTKRAWSEGSAAPFAIVEPAGGEVLGSCTLMIHDRELGLAELGYWTAPWARGRAVATDAARGVCRWALETLGMRRIQWQATVGNFASQLVAARLGFRFEGLGRQSLRRGEGGLADGWVAGLLPGELRPADAPADPELDRVRDRAAVFGRPQPTLTGATASGEPVRLRPMRPEDIPSVVASCRDPLSREFTTVPDPYDEADAESFLHDYAPTVWARGVEAVFAVADADDAFIGSMALRLPGDAMTTPIGDVGYLIGPWARGRGYAPAALRLLCDWGFQRLAVQRIEWRAFVGNEASRTVATRAGFTMEGVARAALRHRDTYRDTWTGARLAAD